MVPADGTVIDDDVYRDINIFEAYKDLIRTPRPEGYSVPLNIHH